MQMIGGRQFQRSVREESGKRRTRLRRKSQQEAIGFESILFESARGLFEDLIDRGMVFQILGLQQKVLLSIPSSPSSPYVRLAIKIWNLAVE